MQKRSLPPAASFLPRPGPVLKTVLWGLLGIWLFFALQVNWLGSAKSLFQLGTAESSAILHGELWRLLTAPLLHVPSGTVSHILSALLGLYFLGSSLEERLGSARFARFLVLTGALSYATQALLLSVLSPAWAERLAPAWAFGAMPVVEAVAIAWAASFKDQQVQLFFVLPVSSRGLMLFVVGMSMMSLIAGEMPPSGHLAGFAGMGWGWLLGGGTPSPLRRLYLRYRLHQLDQEAKSERSKRLDQRPRKRSQGKLRVIEGGRGDDQKLN